MEVIIKGIYTGAMTVLLCIALTILFQNDREMNRMIDQQKNFILEQSVISQSRSKENEVKKNRIDIITYCELIATLQNEITYQVKINELEIDPSFDKYTFNFSLIPKTNYRKRYFYNDENYSKIEKIEYTSIKE